MRFITSKAYPAVLWFLGTVALQAQTACTQPELAHQRKDVETVQQLEHAWSVAYLKGDTDFERCLISSDFTEILRNGEMKTLTDELNFAARNKGKNLPISELPPVTVLIHGNAAVAYGISKGTTADGKPRLTRFSDSYLWENGMWHVFFAQQTAFVEPTGN